MREGNPCVPQISLAGLASLGFSPPATKQALTGACFPPGQTNSSVKGVILVTWSPTPITPRRDATPNLLFAASAPDRSKANDGAPTIPIQPAGGTEKIVADAAGSARMDSRIRCGRPLVWCAMWPLFSDSDFVTVATNVTLLVALIVV
jgi:hypothetical protein